MHIYIYIYIIFIIFFFWLCLKVCRILVPWPGIGPGPLVVKTQYPSHWLSGTSQNESFFKGKKLCFPLEYKSIVHLHYQKLEEKKAQERKKYCDPTTERQSNFLHLSGLFAFVHVCLFFKKKKRFQLQILYCNLFDISRTSYFLIIKHCYINNF